MVTAEQYERAVERAQKDRLVIVHADPAAGEWWVKNPSHSGYYTVSLTEGAYQMTCNCPAGQSGQYCKHRAFVRANRAAKTRLPRLAGRALTTFLALEERQAKAEWDYADDQLLGWM